MRYGYGRGWLAAVLTMALCAHADTANTAAANNNLLTTNDNQLQATLYPKMTLLKGVVMIVKYTNLTKVSKKDFYSGDGMIVAQYLGPEDLQDINVPLLITHLNQVKPITSFDFFEPFDPKHTGYLSKQALEAAKLVFVYYNVNGHGVMLSMVPYGIFGFSYNPQANLGEFLLDPNMPGKSLRGELVNFG